MIDYLKVILECDHKNIGKNLMFKFDNSNLDDDSFKSNFYTGLDIKGHSNSNIKIRTLGGIDSNKIEIQGNLAKFLQGHNLFGINDPKELVSLTFNQLLKNKSLELRPTDNQLYAIEDGVYKATRIDINRNYHLSCKSDVDRWISEARDVMTMNRYGQVKQYDNTLYFGRGSRTKEIKFYGKGAEIDANKSLPISLKSPQMIDYANKTLRFEIRLNPNYLLTNELSYMQNWSCKTADCILNESLANIKILGNMRLTDEKRDTLSPVLQGVYHRWLEGYDLKKCYVSSTFYRYKTKMAVHNIDLSIVLPRFNERTLDLKGILKNNIVATPDWAYEQGLVAGYN